MLASFLRPGSHTAKAFTNPRTRGPADLDRPEYRAVEIPAGGGIGQVRSIARAYSDMAMRRPRARAVGCHARGAHRATAATDGVDSATWCCSCRPRTRSASFARARSFKFGRGPRSFGHPGAGGSFAFADPDAQVAFAYAPNRLGHHLRDDPREKTLRDALYRCLDRTPVPA